MDDTSTNRDFPSRYPAFLSFVFLSLALQAVGITLVRRLFDSDAFVLTMLPPMVAGGCLGKRAGAIIGIIANLTTIAAQTGLGLSLQQTLSQAALGVPFAVAAGVGFGYLRHLSAQSKKIEKKQKRESIKRQQLEKQLEQSQKMEAIGTLAGGVAHDMNNILGIIMSSASIMATDRRPEESAPDLDNILSACRRGKDLTTNLLGFARKGSYIKEVLNLNAIIAESEKLLAPLIDKNIQLTSRPAPALHRVYGDRSQIGQAVMNVCLNAAEAINGSGRVTVTTWNHSTSGSRLIQHRLPVGEYAVVQIQDTGQGIEQEALEHVFEPFFTTKQPGQGTGLGLSMAYGTIKNHGGAIEVESAPGKGTTVTILLPAYQSPKWQETAPPQITMPNGKGSVLVVDDEPLILLSTKRLLGKMGYDVIVADTGAKALEIYRSSPYPIQFVILDFVMPEMDGRETFEALKQIDPNVRVIISSGYSMDGKIEDILDSGARGFIQKPFELSQISKLIGQTTEEINEK